MTDYDYVHVVLSLSLSLTHTHTRSSLFVSLFATVAITLARLYS